MKNTFNLGKDTLYTIEAPGGVIGFDINDHTNIERLKAMYEVFEKEEKRYRAEEVIISKQEDGKKDKFGITSKERKEINNYDKYILGVKNAIDTFFGEGASDKIFYDELLGRVVVTLPRAETLLFDILPEHFEKANLKSEEYMNERLKKRDRFVSKEKDVVDLDEEVA